MVFKLLGRYLFSFYFDFLMSLHPPPPRNPIVDISQLEPCSVTSYLDLLEQAIQLSDDPLNLLNSQVTRLRMPKEQAFTNHEYLLAQVDGINLKIVNFRLERTRGSQAHKTIEEVKASKDPKLAEMGEMIEKLMNAATAPSSNVIPPSSTAIPLSSTAIPLSSTAIPPSPTATPSSTTVHPSPTAVPFPSATPTGPTASAAPTGPIPSAAPTGPTPSAATLPSTDAPYVADVSMVESLSLKSLSSLNLLAPKLGKSVHLADDRIYRVNSFDPPSSDVILHDIKPEGLTLLQFLIIVNIVHAEDIMYSVLAGQCYWFAHLVLLLVQAGFSPGQPQTGVTGLESDLTQAWVHISRHILPTHPDLEERFLKLEKSKNGMSPGTWMSVFVVRIEVALVRKLKSKFDSKWTETRRKFEDLAETKAKAQRKLEDLETENQKLRQRLEAGPLREKQQLDSAPQNLLGDHLQAPSTGASSSRNPGVLPRGFRGRGFHTWTRSQSFVDQRQPGDTSSVRVRNPVQAPAPGTIARVFARLGGRLQHLR